MSLGKKNGEAVGDMPGGGEGQGEGCSLEGEHPRDSFWGVELIVAGIGLYGDLSGGSD